MIAVRNVALVLGVAFAMGCAAAAPPVVSDLEIRQARAGDRLAELYDRLEAEVATLDPARAQAHRARMDEVGELLAAELDAKLQADLEAHRVDGGQIPLESLTASAPLGAPLARWSSSRAGIWTTKLAEEERMTRAAVEIERKQLAALAPGEVVERLAILDRLASLLGPGSPEAHGVVAERETALAALRARAAEAVETENYTDAQNLLRTVRQIDPADTTVSERLADVDSRIVEQRFWMALEEGDPGRAFAMLEEAAASEDFPAIRKRLQGSARVMADYFGELAATAVSEDRPADAYRELGRADAVAALFGEEGVAAGARLAFNDYLKKAAGAAPSPGISWGFLRILEGYSDSTPGLRRQLREARETVERKAVRRVSALPFEDSQRGAEFGEAVGDRVVQYVMEAIPNDVRVIEREQLTEVLREKRLAAAGKGDGVQLASVDYLVQGSILDAKVDSSESEGRKTVRVVTGMQQVPNPEHTAWTGLREKDREDTPEPPRTISVEEREDVTIRLTAHRKVGILAASYRVIDAVSAKVLLADSIRVKEKVEDESSEGVELGDFRMEFKLADLPSDREILNDLADRVSKSIGERLAEFLGNPEAEYIARAGELADEGDFVEAGELYAAALVIAERKSGDVGELLEKLKETAIATAGAAVPASN